MAGFGAQYPCFAPFATDETDTAAPTYENGVVLGELRSANLTVTMASGEIEGDDRLVEKVEEISSAALPIETVDMTDDVAEAVYGSKVVDGALVDSITDEPPYGGLGYFKSLMRKGKKYYRAYFYPKAKASITNDNAQTKGSSITFQPETTNFTIFPPMYEGIGWRYREVFETIAEAKAWIREKLNMT